MTQSLLYVGVFLALLVCAPWAIRWLRQRSGSVMLEAGSQNRMVSAIAVGPHQRVVTVEVGPENARIWLTLGVTPQSISCLYSTPLRPGSPVNGDVQAEPETPVV